MRCPPGIYFGPSTIFDIFNDLPLDINNVFIDLYADDTTLHYIDKSQACIEEQPQTAMQKLSQWCKENGKLINTTKTKSCLLPHHKNRFI